MKLLAFSDLHRDLARARRLVELAGDADVVVGAGDFASVHRGLEETIAALESIERPTVLVAGNNETDDALRHLAGGVAAAIRARPRGDGRSLAPRVRPARTSTMNRTVLRPLGCAGIVVALNPRRSVREVVVGDLQVEAARHVGLHDSLEPLMAA